MSSTAETALRSFFPREDAKAILKLNVRSITRTRDATFLISAISYLLTLPR